MAQEALEKDLFAETDFRARYDRLTKAVEAQVEAPNSLPAHLVSAVLDAGRISNGLRKK